MNSFGKVLTIAIIALGFGIAAAPMASACGGCSSGLVQPAIIDNSYTAPAVLDNTVTQPAVIDNGCSSCGTTLMQPAVIDNGCNTCGTTLMQPALIDNGCNSCANTTLVQPAIIDSGCNPCGTNVLTQPAVINAVRGGWGNGGFGRGFGWHHRRSFLNMGSPFYGYGF